MVTAKMDHPEKIEEPVGQGREEIGFSKKTAEGIWGGGGLTDFIIKKRGLARRG